MEQEYKKILLNYKNYNLKPVFKQETGSFQVILPNVHYQSKIKENIETTISFS